MAKLADAHGSGPCAREGMGVQVPPRAPLSCLRTQETVEPLGSTVSFVLWFEILGGVEDHFAGLGVGQAFMGRKSVRGIPIFDIVVRSTLVALPQPAGTENSH